MWHGKENNYCILWEKNDMMSQMWSCIRTNAHKNRENERKIHEVDFGVEHKNSEIFSYKKSVKIKKLKDQWNLSKLWTEIIDKDLAKMLNEKWQSTERKKKKKFL